MANKTVIQGLEPTDGPRKGGSPSFYTRNMDAPTGGAKGTVVPGMMGNGNGQRPNVNVQPDSSNPHQPTAQTVMSGKPVVGFLYSVSRTMAGEFWPLHVGKNVIGKSTQCDVVLPEGTVSGEHAVLVVRKMKNPEKVLASIEDRQSTNGTLLNGESLFLEVKECKSGDIITIGDNYELYLILLDPVSMGLKVAENFISIQEEEEDDFDPFGDGHTRGGFQPFDSGSGSWGGGNFQPDGGTVGLDGSSGNQHGGTVGM